MVDVLSHPDWYTFRHLNNICFAVRKEAIHNPAPALLEDGSGVKAAMPLVAHATGNAERGTYGGQYRHNQLNDEFPSFAFEHSGFRVRN